MIEIPSLSENRIQQVTLKLLKDCYGDNIPVPVPVEEIIEHHFKIELEIAEINIAGIDGIVDGYADFSQNKIWVHSRLEQEGYYPRMRFTMAHELGHYCLHQAYLKAGQTHYQYAAQTYAKNRPLIERQADMFAANLLMPPPLLYEKWLQMTGSDEPYSLLDEKEFFSIPSNSLNHNFVTSNELISKMAELFETSYQSTKIQLGRSWFLTNSSVIGNTIFPSSTAQGLREKCTISAF